MSGDDKKITAKAMKQVGFTYEEIGDMLGVSKTSAYRYVKEMSGDDWRLFNEFVSKMMMTQESKMIFKVLDSLDSRMDRAKYSDLINLYQSFRKTRGDKPSGVVIGGGEMKIEFIEEDPPNTDTICTDLDGNPVEIG